MTAAWAGEARRTRFWRGQQRNPRAGLGGTRERETETAERSPPRKGKHSTRRAHTDSDRPRPPHGAVAPAHARDPPAPRLPHPRRPRLAVRARAHRPAPRLRLPPRAHRLRRLLAPRRRAQRHHHHQRRGRGVRVRRRPPHAPTPTARPGVTSHSFTSTIRYYCTVCDRESGRGVSFPPIPPPDTEGVQIRC